MILSANSGRDQIKILFASLESLRHNQNNSGDESANDVFADKLSATIKSVIPFRESERMPFKINVIVACSAGSLISALLAILLMLKFDSAFLAFLPTITVPPLACWLGGLRRRNPLIMIAVFATIGWCAGTGFTGVAAMSSQSRIAKNAKLPLAGYDPIVPCAICGGIFALGRACFVGGQSSTAINGANSNSTKR